MAIRINYFTKVAHQSISLYIQHAYINICNIYIDFLRCYDILNSKYLSDMFYVSAAI